ncbi:ECF transporter S component [Pseudoflavonifractor sp. An176]|uniref:ECF transporter S component n=1 Tax=Pseudoflavonifractor sp. An176 TaxID=1965572 RepID=UPI001FA88E75|nr:ECF transporter S component [Pseudoflavonifractor sp. An176]
MYTDKVKTGTGADSWVMVAVWLCVAMAANAAFAPWFSIPELAYQGLTDQFALWRAGESVDLARQLYLVQAPQLLTLDGEMLAWLRATQLAAGLSIPALLLAAVLAWQRKKGATAAVRLSALLALLSVAGAAVVLVRLSEILNASLGQGNTFWDLTVFSHMQLTGFACGQGAAGLALLLGAGRLLNTQRVELASVPTVRGMGRRTRLAAGVILVLIPLLIAFGIVFLKGRSYYFISICVIVAAMLPFFAAFEDRRPQARELVLISSLVVIATAGRAVFFMLPHFKPVTALVIVAGIGLGAEAGFLTGAMTGFVSNFFFGQGPWTPWQMFAFGVIGFLAGLLFEKRMRRGNLPLVGVCVYGFLATVVIYGLLLDTSTALSVLEGLTWQSVLACYVAGVPVNITHGVSTVVFLSLCAKPMLKKIRRMRKKYGLLME